MESDTVEVESEKLQETNEEVSQWESRVRFVFSCNWTYLKILPSSLCRHFQSLCPSTISPKCSSHAVFFSLLPCVLGCFCLLVFQAPKAFLARKISLSSKWPPHLPPC